MGAATATQGNSAMDSYSRHDGKCGELRDYQFEMEEIPPI